MLSDRSAVPDADEQTRSTSREPDDELARDPELERLRRALAESRARESELQARARMYRGALEAIPESVNIRDAARGHWYANPAAHALMEVNGTPEIRGAEREWRYFTENGAELSREEIPTGRALRGEGVSRVTALLKDERTRRERWLEGTAAPILDERGEIIGAVNVVRDISEHRRNEEALARRSAELRARDRENASLIEALEALVQQLSAPALEVWRGVLVVPLIGALDERRGRDLTERTLEAVTRRASRVVIVDVTGASIEDAVAAEQLSRLARALRLLGARLMLAGVRPALASFLVEQELASTELVAHLDLAHALRAAIDALGSRSA